MIISVDTVRDSPETMKAAAKLILELAGESASVPREPVPVPMRVPIPEAAQPVRMVTPSMESTRAADYRPQSAANTPKPLPSVREVNGFEELGLEVYDDNESTPRSVSVALSNRKDEERKTEKAPEKPTPRLPGGVHVY